MTEDDQRFRFLAGIENAVIPDMAVDELAWTGHRGRWRQDLALAAELGVDGLRYGRTWPEIETAPGRYDWQAVDDVLAEMERLHLEPVWDLVHFGVPAYLKDGVLDDRFAPAFAAFAGAFAARYRREVRFLTPWNEPYITAWFRAGSGIWPPHHHGSDAYLRYLMALVTGLRLAMREIERQAPEMRIWLNDGADTFHPRSEDAASEAALRSELRYAPFDLLLGHAVPGQSIFERCRAAGIPAAAIQDEPVRIDAIGLDYYPETEHDLIRDAGGAYRVEPATDPLGLGATAVAYHQRYGLPLFVAESSASGSNERRSAWLRTQEREMRSAAEQGVRWTGYTWWPLFDHVDWDSLLTRRDGTVCPAGLYHLRPTVHDRQPTAAVADLQAWMRRGFPATLATEEERP